MKKIKSLKVVTKLYIGFGILDVLIIALLYMAYTTAATIITLPAERQPSYLGSFATFTAVIFVVFMIISIGISVAIPSVIKKSLKRAIEASEALAIGRVDVELEKLNNDEFGALIDSMQKVVDNTRYQAEITQEVADGNLTVNVQPRSEEDAMGIALRQMVFQNHNSMSGIREAALQVNTSASQVASASEALAQGSTEQASAIEQITASIADVADKTKQNAVQANTAASLAARTIENVKKGNSDMQEMVAAMEEINKSSENISKIIKVIDDIAFQTNILALNAAVEAARAGEAGQGFAVVAEEVRNLAAKSASAAAETAEMIENSIHKTAIGTKIASETYQALTEITTAVQESEAIINEIAASSNYQATAIAQIDQAIEQVSQVVQTNSATSEECAAASQELSEQASRVREMVSAYRLNDNAVPQVQNYQYDVVSADKNEQLISLKGNFGKY